MKVTAALPTGVTALLFDSARRRRQLEARLVDGLDAAGYAEVVLPVVDYLDPYASMLSDESRGELYRFVDRDGEVLALRADFTPMLARLVAPRLASLDLPMRLFYRGDVLRYQEERAGRQREFYQVGAEVLGLPGGDAEAEVMRRFLTLITEAAPGRRLQVVMGFAGALDQPVLRADGDSAALLAALIRRERRPARVAGATLLQVVEHGVPDDPALLGAAAAERLVRLQALRDELTAAFPDVELVIDLAEFADQTVEPSLRATLGARAYYDGLVFRAFGGAAALPLGGGGRYDQLFRGLGAEVTAAGFSLSVDRLLEKADRRPEEVIA